MPSSNKTEDSKDGKTLKIKVKVKVKMKRALSPAKAKMMLKDNSAQGHPLTSKQKKLFGAIAGGAKPYKRKTISLPKKELVQEHKELVQTLKHGSKSELKKEAKDQSKELTEYKGMRKKRGIASAYQSAGKGLENIGSTIMQNLQAGQKSPNVGKANFTINPLKGTGQAFTSAFKSKRKLERAMKGYRK